MKWKIVTIASCAALLFVGAWAAAVAADQPLPHRYLQHEESQQVGDLSEEDQAAVLSDSTDPATFASHLPVISIDTHGQEIPGAPAVDAEGRTLHDEHGQAVPTLAPDGLDYITADVAVYDAQGAANRLSDEPTISSECQIRVRGNSSRLYDKKNYRISLVNNDGTDNSQPLLGMESSEAWALQGTSIDKTMMRNYLTYNLAGQFMANYVPEVRYCEVFVNGEYYGLYGLTETIKVQDGRIELNESDPDSAETSYLAAIDELGASETTVSNFLFYTLRLNCYIDVLYPGELSLTAAQKRWIEDDISAFEKALFSYDYDTLDYGYDRFIDTDSFVDMYILNEFAINDDFGAFSTYLYKDVRGRLVLGPPWDYDNCYDNYQDQTPTDGFYVVQRAWYFMLMKDEAFAQDVIDRYRSLRQDVLSEEHIFEMIDATAGYLAPAMERNWARWGYTFSDDHYLFPESRRPASYEEAVADLKSFIHDRGTWLDTYIENIKQYSHESAVKKFNH